MSDIDDRDDRGRADERDERDVAVLDDDRRSPSQSPKKERSASPARAGSPDRSPKRDRSVSPDRGNVRRDRSRSASRDRQRSRSRDRRRSPSRDRDRRRSNSRDRYRRDRSRSPPRRRSRSRDRSGYGMPYRREPPRVGLQMFVAGFNFLSTERDVERRFGKYGRVTEVRIVRDTMGKSRGFGFVAMDNERDVQECIRAMNGRDWEGRRLQVELCRNPK